MYVIFNQHLIHESKAAVPISDRGFLFGEGVFTTLRVENGVSFCLNAHLKRFKTHCMRLGIAPPDIQESTIDELIQANQAFTGFWRLKLIRTPETFLITLKQYDPSKNEPQRLINYPEPMARPLSEIKSLSYLDYLWIRKFAIANGFDDAIIKNAEGCILETTRANLVWKIDDTMFTPCHTLKVLKGVALDFFIKISQKIGLTLQYVKEMEIPGNANVYLTNSMCLFLPVITIDRKTYPIDVQFEETFKLFASNIYQTVEVT